MTRLRVLAGSAFVGGSVWTFADKETRDDILFPFRSVARGIRVVSTVTSISADYKWTFFKLRNVTDTEERRLTINDAHLRYLYLGSKTLKGLIWLDLLESCFGCVVKMAVFTLSLVSMSRH